MTSEEARERISAYAIGALDPEEARAVEEYLRTASPEEQREWAAWRETAAMLPLALPEVAPPPALREDLLKRIAPAQATVLPFAAPRRPASTMRQGLLLAASLLLACASAVLFWQNTRLLRERDQLAGKLDAMQRDWGQFLSPGTRVVSLNGVETPQANAKIVWDTRQQVWKIYILNLPAPPPDKDYQLCYVTRDQKLSAAVFRTGPGGDKILELTLPPQALSGLAATAVTLEPRGGSPQPTSKFYLLGQI